MSKRTLYQHFPSKAAVIEEYLRTIQHSHDDAGKIVTKDQRQLVRCIVSNSV